jgi:DNA modification methylase
VKHRLFNGNCLEVLADLKPVSCIFADPPDNIGLGYDAYDDKLADEEYRKLLYQWVAVFVLKAPVIWLSFNARWTAALGAIVDTFTQAHKDWEFKPCVQVFTFGQHNKHDLGNNHRPLWRLRHKDAPLYPDAIKVPSWRQRNGDKRAAAGGRVPGDVFDHQYPGLADEAVEALAHRIVVENSTGGANYGVQRAMEHARHGIKLTLDAAEQQPGDVFDFPRVTGNSKQRCDWHPTQLHEELVERALRLTTKEGDTVLDPFGGTGTTLRVCKKIGRACTLIELDPAYCKKLRELHPELKKRAA